MELYATEFMVDDNALYLVASDSQNCIQLFSYSPNNLHSIGGQRLLRRGDICTGSLIQKFIRICTRTVPNSRSESGIVTSNEKRQLCLFGTLDGALGFVSPIPEQQYKRLSQLYNKMTTMMVHTAGLNPKGYRLQGGCNSAATSGSPYFPNPTKTILDCQLIFRFLNLSLIDQNDLAKSIGTTSDRIYLDLIELQWNFSVI
jgi:cleavage and polyadenylation specificity factor subunit 1